MGVTHLVAVADELLRNVDELLELVRHRGRRYGGRYSGGLEGRGRNTAGYGLAVDVESF